MWTKNRAAFVRTAGAARPGVTGNVARVTAAYGQAKGVARIAERVAERARALWFAHAHAAAAIATPEKIAAATVT